MAALGGKCLRCPQDDPRTLEIDHVYSDGYEERHIRGVAFLRLVLASLDSGRYQLLCSSCHSIKTATNFEYGRRLRLDVIDDLSMLAAMYEPDD